MILKWLYEGLLLVLSALGRDDYSISILVQIWFKSIFWNLSQMNKLFQMILITLKISTRKDFQKNVYPLWMEDSASKYKSGNCSKIQRWYSGECDGLPIVCTGSTENSVGKRLSTKARRQVYPVIYCKNNRWKKSNSGISET